MGPFHQFRTAIRGVGYHSGQLDSHRHGAGWVGRCNFEAFESSIVIPPFASKFQNMFIVTSPTARQAIVVIVVVVVFYNRPLWL